MADTSLPKSSAASSMAELMAKHTTPLVTFKKGDIIKGIITKLAKPEILVDIDAKTDAVVMERDSRILKTLLARLKVGDEVQVQILNPESDSGQPVVSLRRFLDDASWEMLNDLQKNHKQLEVAVAESTKGGFLVHTDFGITGFLPHSHALPQGNQQVAVGRVIKVAILDLNRSENKVIFTQKIAMPVEEFEAIARQFKIGQKIAANITNITTFGMFVSLQIKGVKNADGEDRTNIDGLVHISEVAWEKVGDLNELYKVGQEIEAVVLGFDKDARRIDFSLKRLTQDPFQELVKKYPVDKKVQGKVSKMADGNIHVELGDKVEGIIRKEKIPPTMKFEVGGAVIATVSEHDNRRRRLGLVPVLKEKPIGYR